MKILSKKDVQAQLWHESALQWLQIAIVFKAKSKIDKMLWACQKAEHAFDKEDKLRIQLAQKSGRIAKA